MPKHEKTIRELNLEDDFLFGKVMTDKEICRKVLEQILGISIRQVMLPDTQRTFSLMYEGKGVRLDVYVNDDEGTIYNVEMQRGKKKELPKRARYYQGNIDLDLISAGEPYTALHKTYVIFICTFDPFQDSRHMYTFENICRENPQLSLGDETVKLFLNTRGTMDDVALEMKEFLTYLENTTETFAAEATNPLIRELQKKVTEVKQSEEMEVEYMTLLQRDRENIELGREEGAAWTTEILRLHVKGVPEESIASRLNLELSYIEQIIHNFEKEE